MAAVARPEVVESWEEQGPLSRYDESGASFVTSPVINSGGALRLEATASRAALSFGGLAGGKHLSTYIQFETLPVTDIDLFTIARVSGFGPSEVGLSFDSATGKAKPVARDPSNTHYGPLGSTVIVADTWYLIDFEFTGSSVQWRMGEAPGTPTDEGEWTFPALSGGGAIGTVVLGQNSDNGSPTGTYAMFFGPTAVFISFPGQVPAYPIGEHGCATLHPSGEGTHVNAADFTDDLGNSPPVDPHLRLDDSPETASDTDLVYQSGTDAAAYLEYELENLPSTAVDPVLGSVVTFGYDTNGSSSVARMLLRWFLAGVDQTLLSGIMTGTFSNKVWRATDVDGIDEYTVADVNASKLRVSAEGDNSPLTRIRSLWVNVAYSLPPPPSPGAPAELYQLPRTHVEWRVSPNRFRRPRWL